jgi:hypothetical protein
LCRFRPSLGFRWDFAPGESVFGATDAGVLEEPTNDSQWGPFNDINQIKVTWDAQNLYVACDGFIWDNNMILLMDFAGSGGPDFASDGEGLTAMTGLNSWRRRIGTSNCALPLRPPDRTVRTHCR